MQGLNKWDLRIKEKKVIHRKKISTMILMISLVLSIVGCKVEEPEQNVSAQEKYGVANIEMVNGVPTPMSSKKIFDAMDYYGAVRVLILTGIPRLELKTLPSLPNNGSKVSPHKWTNRTIDIPLEIHTIYS